jgi:hypothetical protein
VSEDDRFATIEALQEQALIVSQLSIITHVLQFEQVYIFLWLDTTSIYLILVDLQTSNCELWLDKVSNCK